MSLTSLHLEIGASIKTRLSQQRNHIRQCDEKMIWTKKIFDSNLKTSVPDNGISVMEPADS